MSEFFSVQHCQRCSVEHLTGLSLLCYGEQVPRVVFLATSCSPPRQDRSQDRDRYGVHAKQLPWQP